MNVAGSTQEELLIRLDKRGVIVGRRTGSSFEAIARRIVFSRNSEQLINSTIFFTQLTYCDDLVS
jgi:hypothetical protein